MCLIIYDFGKQSGTCNEKLYLPIIWDRQLFSCECNLKGYLSSKHKELNYKGSENGLVQCCKRFSYFTLVVRVSEHILKCYIPQPCHLSPIQFSATHLISYQATIHINRFVHNIQMHQQTIYWKNFVGQVVSVEGNEVDVLGQNPSSILKE